MIRTKYLRERTDTFNHLEIDELINNFLAENPNIEIIDIKYQSNVALAIYEYDFRKAYDTSALIIYREPEKYISRLGIEFGEEDDEQR